MVIGERNTGNYHARLRWHAQDETYYVDVLYTGAWSGGETVEVILLEDTDRDDAQALDMFAEAARGDFDVESLLAQAGFDQYTNAR